MGAMIVWIGAGICVLGAVVTGFMARLCWRYRRQTEDALREIRALRAQQIYLTEPTSGRGPYCKLCRDYGCGHPHTGRPAPVKRLCPGPEAPGADIPEDCCEQVPCKGITKRGEIIYGPFE